MRRSPRLAWFMGVFLAAAMTAPTVQASQLSQKEQTLQQLQSQSNALNQQIAKEKATAVAVQNQLTTYEQELATVRRAQISNLTQLRQTEQHIAILQRDIAANTLILNRDKTDLSAQFRLMYENGTVPYLQVLFSATSWTDFLTRLSMLTDLARSRQHLMQQTTRVEERLSSQKRGELTAAQALKRRRVELLLLQAADSLLQNRANQTLSLAQSQLHAASYRHGLLESQIRLTSQQIQQIKEETARAEALMQNSSYVAQAQQSLVPANVGELIHYAESYMGVPYVWGGESPSGFDCSGFTQYVFSHFGINIYRTSEEQFAQGVPVSKNNLQPGDLVFFTTYAPGATHVGIYIGNGLMVDAQDNGVSIDNINSSYWAPKYLGARQYIK